MTVPFGSKVKVRSVVASLAIALAIAPGCKQDEETPSANPANPVPRADLPRPVQPPSEKDKGGVPPAASNVEKDLRKDLGSPVIKPDVPATTTPPPAKPDAAKPDTTKPDTTKTGQP
jgi:hypothetical protein